MARIYEFPTGRVLVREDFQKLASHRCKACGTVLAPTHRPEPQRCYCDAACRSRAWRARHG